MNHGHTLLIDDTRRRVPELERAAGARLLACWSTLHYLREFFEVADMPLPLLLPGPNLRYATMRMYTHDTTEGRRKLA